MHRWILWTVVALSFLCPGLAEASNPWTEIQPEAITARGEREIAPSIYRALELDHGKLAQVLAATPLAGSAHAETQMAVLELPLPSGWGRFRIEQAPIMAPELAARFPGIKTYRGQGIEDPAATLRFDVTPKGLHGMIMTPSEVFWIDPFQRRDRDHYVVYSDRHYSRAGSETFECGVHSDSGPGLDLARIGLDFRAPPKRGSLPSNGGTLRTYRIAVAATGEFTAAHSDGAPTVAEGLAAVVTAMNRVNAIFERSLSLTMTLVADNDQLIYTDSGSDPYSGGNLVSMMFENETNLNSVIGLANYDIGHVFGTGSGGVAIVEVPCTATKARGASGLGEPINDGFWVRVVAHEIAHQWGAGHSFNGNTGACAGSQHVPASAYEPGSGSTIQSYAGLCSPQNMQASSDPYYHSISLQEMVEYSVNGDGSSCASESVTGNGIPSVDAGPSHTIPVNTAFELCGSGSDPDSHPLTFVWEQFNLGPTGPPDNPTGDAPIFRSRPPSESPCRTFPRLSDLLTGVSSPGELLPSYERVLTFRLTARDNQASGGAFATDSVDIAVSDQAGPFLLTSPNSGAWMRNQPETVTWDVAGTDMTPVSCPAVDILLSTDGGLTFPHVLADDTANDGEHSVVVTQGVTTTARVKIVCANNVFFDISDQDVAIEQSDDIFADGFEIGDTNTWSSTVPDAGFMRRNYSTE